MTELIYNRFSSPALSDARQETLTLSQSLHSRSRECQDLEQRLISLADEHSREMSSRLLASSDAAAKLEDRLEKAKQDLEVKEEEAAEERDKRRKDEQATMET